MDERPAMDGRAGRPEACTITPWMAAAALKKRLDTLLASAAFANDQRSRERLVGAPLGRDGFTDQANRAQGALLQEAEMGAPSNRSDVTIVIDASQSSLHRLH